MQKLTQKEQQTLAQVERQVQVLRPLQQAEVRILRMSQQELEQDVRNQLDANPALEEYDDNDITSAQPDEGNNAETPEDDAVYDETDPSEKTEYSQEDYVNDRINDYSPDDVPTYYDPDNTHERIIADQTSFYQSLKEQAASCNLSDRQEQILDYLIGSLDEDGYLRKTVRILRDEMEVYEGIDAPLEEVENVLHILQSFEPTGIGAKDLQESLVIQLRNLDHDNPLRTLAIDIISRAFDDYKNKRYEKLAARFKIDRPTIEQIYNLVRHLNPRPGTSVASSDNVAAPVSPDFYVFENDGSFDIGLYNDHIPKVKVSSSYADFAANAAASVSGEQTTVRRQVNEAKLYVAAIRQRQQTMLSTMYAIVHLQPEFFREGDRTLLHPMTQKNVADIIHRDPSTVSGVVSNKYADTSFGLVALASLFTQSFVNQQGEEVSREAIKIKMRNLIANEDPLHPLSDDELAAKLGIARRTVAKYRKTMRIPVARLRR